MTQALIFTSQMMRSCLFASQLAEYAGVIGVNGSNVQARVGNLLNLGRCLYVPECPATLMSAHVLEQAFDIEYQPMSYYKVLFSRCIF